MKPLTAGERVRELRETLRASQKIIEDLSGLSHAQVSKAESRDIGWRSADVCNGFAKAFSMTHEQFEDFREGRMRLEQALAIARDKIEAAKAHDSNEGQIDTLARTAVKSAGVDEEWAESTLALMRMVVRERGVETSMPELIAEAKRFARGLPALLGRKPFTHKSDRTDRAR